MNSLTVKINDKFKPLFQNKDCRYFIITGGRGSGKSFGASINEVVKTFQLNYRCLFTRYTMSSAHLSIIPEFLEKIEKLNLEHFFSINKTQIKNESTNSEIIFRGIKTSSGNQTANLKSIQGISTWILDEAEELTDENIFEKIELSIRTKGVHNKIILILNPTTKEHWIYKRFFEEAGVDPYFNGIKKNVCYIHTNYKDNIENLDESFLNRIEEIKKNNLEKYNHKILGGWLDKAEGVVFTNWEIGDFNPNNLQTSFGQDYGFSIDPTTLVEVAIDKKQKNIYVKEHLYKAKLTTSQILEINLRIAKDSLIVADRAEDRLIEELNNGGCNIQKTIKGAGSVKIGVNKMQDYKIIIEPNSVNIIKEFNNYIYIDKKSQMYIDDYNHCIDAIRYNVMYHLSADYDIILR